MESPASTEPRGAGLGLEEDTHQGLEGLLGRSSHSGSQKRRAWNLHELSTATGTNRHSGFKQRARTVSVSSSGVRVGSARFSVPAFVG